MPDDIENMLDFIKKLFKKPVEKETIIFSDIKYWLKKKKEDKKEITTKLENEYLERRKGIIKDIPEKKTLLQKAVYDKPVQQRILSIIDQNRTMFLKQVDKLLDSLENQGKASDLINDTEKKVNQMLSNSGKLIHTVKHLYFEETDNLMLKIKELLDVGIKFKKEMKNTKLSMIEKALQEFEDHRKETEKKQMFNKKILDSEEELKKAIRETKIKQKENEEFLKSNESKAHYSLLKKKELAEKYLKLMENNFINLFSPLERPLKKYSKISMENKFILDYITNPISALKKDKELKILNILEKMRQSIDKLELKDKKKLSVLKTIDKIKEKELKNFVDDHDKHIKDNKNINEEIKKDKFTIRKDNLKKELDEAKDKVSKIKKDIEDYKKIKDSTYPEKTKASLKEKIKKISDKEVEIC